MAPASTISSDVDDVIVDAEDVLLPIDDVDVWIDPLDATQVGGFRIDLFTFKPRQRIVLKMHSYLKVLGK